MSFTSLAYSPFCLVDILNEKELHTNGLISVSLSYLFFFFNTVFPILDLLEARKKE